MKWPTATIWEVEEWNAFWRWAAWVRMASLALNLRVILGKSLNLIFLIFKMGTITASTS